MKTAFHIVLTLICLGAAAQDTTRILFVGNSFTYFSNMPVMVKALADSAGLPVEVGQHTPGGISVGDIAQGSMAHMNNPVLYSLIRSERWDFVVIQDNQGRFLRDSAEFPSSSLVVQGHLQIMDSVRANNNCAKVILFAGWAFKNGSPPFGNTGIDMIRRIMRNYVVLNDTMKEVIAPIGEAWIKAISYLPAVNLWDPDDAHPSYAGSYLTASTIFSTIFNKPAKNLDYDGALLPGTAFNLRAFADSSVFNPVFHVKYNLGGIKKIMPQHYNGGLHLKGNFSSYLWYANELLVNTDSVLPVAENGRYRALVREADGCYIKTCTYTELSTGLSEEAQDGGLIVFPNPSNGSFTIEGEGLYAAQVRLFNMNGAEASITVESTGKASRIITRHLVPGCYMLQIKCEDRTLRKKIVIGE